MAQSNGRKVDVSYLLPLWEPDLSCSFEPVEIRHRSRPTLPPQSLIQDSFLPRTLAVYSRNKRSQAHKLGPLLIHLSSSLFNMQQRPWRKCTAAYKRTGVQESMLCVWDQ